MPESGRRGGGGGENVCTGTHAFPHKRASPYLRSGEVVEHAWREREREREREG